MYIEKNTKNNGKLIIREISYDIAKRMIMTNHYSKKWNSGFGKINIGIFKNGLLQGCAVFGNLMNPSSHTKITKLGSDSVVELNRLWISDKLKKNAESVLISSSFKIIKSEYPYVKYVQSFADGRLGCGTIYKATNFKYFGYNKSLFFENIDNGEISHKVLLENTKRPLSFILKNRQYLDKKLKAFYVKTYRYIYPLYRNLNINLTEKEYPSYDKGIEITNHNHSIGLLSRLYLMYKAIGDDKYSKKCMVEMEECYSESEINKELENQKSNKSYIWFVNDYISNYRNKNKLLIGNTYIKEHSFW